MIIPPYLAAEGVRQALGRIAAGGGQHRADAAIAARDPAVSLRMTGLDEAVIDAVAIAGAVAAMTPGGITFTGGAEAIGKFLAVIGQDLLHREGRLREESLQKTGRIHGGFLAEHLHLHPARGAIDADAQIAMGVFVRHPRQLLDIDRDEARLIILKGFLGLIVVFWRRDQGLEIRDALPAQAAIQTRA